MYTIHFRITTSHRLNSSFTTDAYYRGRRIYDVTPLAQNDFKDLSEWYNNLHKISDSLLSLFSIYKSKPNEVINISDAATQVCSIVSANGYSSTTKVYSKDKISISFSACTITVFTRNTEN